MKVLGYFLSFLFLVGTNTGYAKAGKFTLYLQHSKEGIRMYPNDNAIIHLYHGREYHGVVTGEPANYEILSGSPRIVKINYFCNYILKNPDTKSKYAFFEDYIATPVIPGDRRQPYIGSISSLYSLRNKEYPGNRFYPGLIRANCWDHKPSDAEEKRPQFTGAMFFKVQEGIPPKDVDQTAGLYWTTASVLNVRTKPTTKSKVAFALPFGTKIFVKEKTNVMFTYEGKTAAWWKIMTPYEEEGYVFSGFLTPKYEDLPPLHPDVGKWVEVIWDCFIYPKVVRKTMDPSAIREVKKGEKFQILAVGPPGLMDYDKEPYPWYKIRIGRNKTAWIYATQVKLLPPEHR